MLVNIYVLGLILKGTFTSIHLLRETGLNRSFSGLHSQKSKDWTGKKTGPQSSPVQLWSFCSPRTGLPNTTSSVSYWESLANDGGSNYARHQNGGSASCSHNLTPLDFLFPKLYYFSPRTSWWGKFISEEQRFVDNTTINSKHTCCPLYKLKPSSLLCVHLHVVIFFAIIFLAIGKYIFLITCGTIYSDNTCEPSFFQLVCTNWFNFIL